ncbi:MAG: DUF1847 domain-containing protein [Candidatus Omnitrophica bacterium]|nr:DUF1847 domain-containing protein [Candidatus Omnitrophota bacterium]
MHCAVCKTKDCKNGKDCFQAAEAHQEFYRDGRIQTLLRAAASIEARHYCQETRIRETILFAKELGVKRLGLAFCVGLSEEAREIEALFKRDFEVVSVCCKVGGIYKSTFDLEQIHSDQEEVMCNPAGQAEFLNQVKTDLNVLCGLCVGHDAIFNMRSQAPVTTLIAKDRVLGHNPAAALYCQYIHRNL